MVAGTGSGQEKMNDVVAIFKEVQKLQEFTLNNMKNASPNSS